MFDRPPRTIRRLVVGHIIAFGLLSLALSGGAYLIARHLLAARQDANMQNRMAVAARKARSGGTARLAAALREVSDQGGQFGYVLTTADGKRLRAAGKVGLLPVGWGTTAFHDPDDGRIDPARTLTAKLPDGSTLTILSDRDYAEDFDLALIGYIALASAVLLTMALVGSLSLESEVRRRLRRVNETAASIMHGDLTTRVPTTGLGDEFDALSTTINLMLDRIAGLFEEVRRISSYVAHDLRTPLARLASELRADGERCSTAEGCRAAITVAAARCDEMIELVGSILQLGQIDGVRVQSQGAVFDLSVLVTSLSEAHYEVAAATGRHLHASVRRGVHVFGMKDLIAQALINLFDNALKHTAADAEIVVLLSADAHMATLSVLDNSPASDNESPLAFLTEDRRSKFSEGDRMAVGLKLVRAIVVAHSGTLTMTRDEAGLRVEIALPLVSTTN